MQNIIIMANCTISTMEVNDCHLQFFDSLGNLIYEFDLETIIALNNGNGILIKDELTTLTIDNNIVVDNLELTIAELITYIQEQRVLCTCACGDTPTATTTSATWGYDVLGTLFYVKQMSDGTIVYESPIGTVTAPTGDVTNKTTSVAQILISIETTGSGNVSSGLEYSIQNLTATAGSVNFTNFAGNSKISGRAIYDNQQGVFKLTPTIPYDAGGATTFLINYTT